MNGHTWKRLLAGICSCVAILALNMACKSEPAERTRSTATVIDLKNDSPVQRQKTSVYVGELFRVRLPVQSGTGFTWIIESGASDMGVVNLVSRSSETSNKGPPGAPSHEIFDLRANRSGETTVEFAYQRPWERNVPPARRLLLVVDVGY